MVLSRTRLVDPLATNAAIALCTALAFAAPRLAKADVAARIFAPLAAFSYSLYLIHSPLGIVLAAAFERLGLAAAPAGMTARALICFALTAAATLALAWAFGRATESRTGSLRRLILSR